jgi:hypothetical protein
MQDSHAPVIDRRADGLWEVNCPECLRLRALGVDIPVGIGMSVRSWEYAVRLWMNHLDPVGESQERQAQALITWSRQPLRQKQ